MVDKKTYGKECSIKMYVQTQTENMYIKKKFDENDSSQKKIKCNSLQKKN